MVSTETSVKIAVCGPRQSGKTLLCRALAEQSIILGEGAYSPTVGVRIQELAKEVGYDRVKIQLWDCSGNTQYQSYWPVLSKDLDGLILIVDPQRPEQEKELEIFYRNFAEPNNLYTRQCMVLAVQVLKEGSNGLVEWKGLKGGLSKLTQGYISINPANPAAGVKEALVNLNQLFAGCLQTKKDAMESKYMGQGE